MTGYGRGRAVGPAGEVVVEIGSVNRKSLDIAVSAPRDLPGAERLVVERLRAVLDRGKVQVSVTTRPAGGALVGAWDDAALGAALDRLGDFARRRGLAFEPDAGALVALALGLRAPAQPEAEAGWQPLLESALEAALAELQVARSREGEALAADLRHRLGLLAGWRDEIAALAPGSAAAHREALLARIAAAGLGLDAGDERVLKEVAFFADRSDVTEELVRLASHLAQAESFLAEAGPVGRKLEFLFQEIQRECNTLGSKSATLDITRLALACRNEVEKLREQAANIE